MSDELIKIAPNGQWSLEKSTMSDEQRKKLIERFLADRNRPSAPAPKPKYPEGMRPAQVSTMDHKGDPRAASSRNQIEAIRAAIDAKEDKPVVIERKNITADQLNAPPAATSSKNASVDPVGYKTSSPQVSTKPTLEQVPHRAMTE